MYWRMWNGLRTRAVKSSIQVQFTAAFKRGKQRLKREGTTTEFSVSWHGKSPVSPLFLHGLHSLWIDLELSSKKFNDEMRINSSSFFLRFFNELNIGLNFGHWVRGKKLNWISVQFWTDIQPCPGLTLSLQSNPLKGT